MSTLRVNTLQDATGSNQPAMVGAAKAWVNFDGTGTVAIRAAFNVSSITDNGTGDYTVNFTNAFSDSNYAVSSISSDSSKTVARIVGAGSSGNTTYSTTAVGLSCRRTDTLVIEDMSIVNVIIFR